MKVIAIQKAARRLANAEANFANLVELAKGMSVHKFEDEWFSFLVNLHCVPEILRTTARNDATARQWIGSKFTHEIRKDPVLRFLLQARGTDFHGIEGGTTPHVEGAKYLGYETNLPFGASIRAPDGTRHEMSGGAIVLEGHVRSFSFTFRLSSVTDKDGNTFEPPESHFGEKLADASPVAVAGIALDYYRSLLTEAAKRASP